MTSSFVVGNVDLTSGSYSATGIISLASLVFFSLLMRVVKSSVSKHKGFTSSTVSGMTMGLIVGPVSTWMFFNEKWAWPSVAATIRDGSELSAAANTTSNPIDVPYTPMFNVLVAFTLGEFLAQLLHIRDWWSKPTEDAIMVFHHLTSIISWPVALHYKSCQVFILTYMATELSNPVMHAFFLTEKHAPPAVHSVVAPFFGFAFTIVFTVVRLFTLPHFFGFIYAARASYFSAHLPFFVKAFQCLTPAPALLNIWWGYEVWRLFLGRLALLLGLGGGSAAEEEKHGGKKSD